MANIPTGYNLPKNAAEMSDDELKQQLMADYKQTAVKKTNFPTEIVPLPSKGLLYSEDHPLAEGTIEMKYMTAKEEDILTSQNLIKQGVVLDKLFQSLIVTPVNYNDLYVGDKNAIMIAARILGYGKDYVVEIEDPSSPGTKQKVTIDLTQIEHKEVDYSLFEKRTNEFDFELPQSKRVVTFRLLTHGVENDIDAEIKGLTKQINRSGIDRALTTRLKHIILAVDGERGRATINNFVDNELFAQDSRALRAYMKDISPDLDMTFTFISDTTGEASELTIPMDISFFWPGT
jgi:predicted DNA binding CopG/RHH family protein